MSSDNKLQTLLYGPLRNYLYANNKVRLAATSKVLYNQLENNKNIKVSKKYQQMKRAFFLRAFVREIIQLYDRISPRTPLPTLLVDISNHMAKLYNNLSDPNNKRTLLGSNASASIDSRILFNMFFVNMLIKLRNIDKILTNLIADDVKKIINLTHSWTTTNKNALKELVRKDHHFKSNPDAVFKTLTMVHYRSGHRGLTQRKVSGNRTLRILRSMIGGLKPLDYVQTSTWTFNQYSPVAQIVDFGKIRNTNQSFITLLSPEVSKKSVKKFLSTMRLKNGAVHPIRVNHTNNGVIGRNFIPLGNSSNNNNNRPTNQNSITKIQETLRMNRRNINAFVAKFNENFNKNRNTIPVSKLRPILQSRNAEKRQHTKNKGKMPMGFDHRINYSSLFN